MSFLNKNSFLKNVSYLTKLLLALAISSTCALAQTNVGDGVFYAGSITANTNMSTPVLFGGAGQGAGGAGSTLYSQPQGYTNTWSATETLKQVVVPVDGTISKLYIRQNSSTTTGEYIYTLRLNGAATALTCTCTVGNATCNDTSNSFAVVAGDVLSLESDPNSSPDLLVGNLYGTVMFSAGEKESLVMGAVNGNITATTTRYFPIQSVSNGNTTENLASGVIPTGGELSDLYVDLDGDPTAGQYDIELFKNGAASGLNVTVASGSTTGSNTGTDITVAAGDLVSIEIQQTGGPTVRNLRWGMRWKPTTNGESIQVGGAVALGTSSSTQYIPIADGVSGTANNTEAARTQLIQACDVRNLYIGVVTAVGAGNSVAFTARKNAADTTLTATISGAAQTTNSDLVNSVTFAAGDRIGMKMVKSAGMPAGDGVHTGVVTYVTPGP